jgi:uncharacterized membrane protein YfcA
MIFYSIFIPQSIVLVLTGLLSGFVDSIAGGGGLINLPVLTLILGPGALAIGTNKIPGAVAALIALLVYIRAGHMNVQRSLIFTFWVGVGALCGSRVAPYLPIQIFRWLLVGTCPVILWIVWRKDLWIEKDIQRHSLEKQSPWVSLMDCPVLLSGVLCGFYDGVWGPGGGTFMFLSLLFFAKLPLLSALAASKLANTCSATVALASYATGGYVHWKDGFFLAGGICMGAFFGARNATRRSSQIVRPVLVCIVVLLIFRLLSG